MSLQPREGPVQFEKDNGDDPFGVAALIADVEKGSGNKRYGLDEGDRVAKRAKVDDE